MPSIDEDYHTPQTLRVSDVPPRRVLLIGSCQLGYFPSVIQAEGAVDRTVCDFVHVNYGCHLPELPPQPLVDFDFAMLQIPVRTFIWERLLMRYNYNEPNNYLHLFNQAKQIIEMSLSNGTRWTRECGMPIFVFNFLAPQQNPFGRFMPRYDLRNAVFMMEELNRHLIGLIDTMDDVYLLDIDQISAMHGRRFIQDDSFMLFAHSATIEDFDDLNDLDRIEPPEPLLADRYGSKSLAFRRAVWLQAIAMYRTLRQIDIVKLVVVDLDDTLWRGVAAEGAGVLGHTREGWPFGFAEALLYLKKRGVLLAVLSKNDDSTIREIWPAFYGDYLEISDFAAWSVSWDAKQIGMATILQSLNLLPKSVVFIDDNPRERAEMALAYPDMRIIGQDPHSFRRTLLWASETQVATITEESLRRTEMMQAQVEREAVRRTLSHEEFLKILNPKSDVFEVETPRDARFQRSLELLNKTNQFNTTGRKWLKEELIDAMEKGTRLFAFEVEDNYTKYGLVGLALFLHDTFIQFVMSCRVMGLGVEENAVDEILRLVNAVGAVKADWFETPTNRPAEDIWRRCNFSLGRDGRYIKLASKPA